MVDPSPPSGTDSGAAPGSAQEIAQAKAQLRRQYRKARADQVASLPNNLRALILNRPPAPLLDLIPQGATVGLYHPAADEAPSLGWARWLSENGHDIALPWFATRESAMEFRIWGNPWDDGLLGHGPWRALQPLADAPSATPDVVIVPLIAFTAQGHRLGQGGGHYDRWLAGNPDATAIGLAWDVQIAEELPTEPHDRPLAAVVTPTRIYHGDR